MASSLASQSLQQHISIGLRQSFSLPIFYSLFLFFLTACGPSRYISKQGNRLLSDSNLRNAHVGISIFDISGNKNIYSHQSDKYFIPASNTKILTCYAAMKYLGDSLPGLRYFIDDLTTVIKGSGDPTVLHPDFPHQPVMDFLAGRTRLGITGSNRPPERWGYGWNIGDINASYMPERSELPVHGNVLRIFRSGDSIKTVPSLFRRQVTLPSGKSWMIDFERTSLNENFFDAVTASSAFRSREVPFVTGSYMSALVILSDTLKKSFAWYPYPTAAEWKILYARHTDSVLKPMMHRSDNFFAEQVLLMTAEKLVGEMRESRLIDTLLKTDLDDLPQKPRWVDGSGLSRYNLFSPDDFIAVLQKIRNEFEWNRVTTIFATGGEGTLTGYYQALQNRIFAKTGTLSNNVALSGYIVTRKNKTLIFSVLVNNHVGSAPQIRRAVEKFIVSIAENY